MGYIDICPRQSEKYICVTKLLVLCTAPKVNDRRSPNLVFGLRLSTSGFSCIIPATPELSPFMLTLRHSIHSSKRKWQNVTKPYTNVYWDGMWCTWVLVSILAKLHHIYDP